MVEIIDGTYYNFNIDLTSQNIFYSQPGYCDREGIPITIIGDKTEDPKEDDPVNPSATEKISLTVSVRSWAATPEQL